MLNFQVSLKSISVLLLAILSAHLWATLSSAYFYFWWLDIVMHIAGGLWIGMIALYLIRNQEIHPLIIFCLVFGAAAIVGLFWEFWEFICVHFFAGWFGRIFMQGGLEDTLSDLLSDLIGGILAFLLLKRPK